MMTGFSNCCTMAPGIAMQLRLIGTRQQGPIPMEMTNWMFLFPGALQAIAVGEVVIRAHDLELSFLNLRILPIQRSLIPFSIIKSMIG